MLVSLHGLDYFIPALTVSIPADALVPASHIVIGAISVVSVDAGVSAPVDRQRVPRVPVVVVVVVVIVVVVIVTAVLEVIAIV